MTTGNRSPYDIILKDKRTDPQLSLGLTLAPPDRNGNPTWTESRKQPLPERRSSGELSFTHRDPTYDLVWSQIDFSAGALQTYWSSEEPNSYALSNNLDLRATGVVGLSSKPSSLSLAGQQKFLGWDNDLVNGWADPIAGKGTVSAEEGGYLSDYHLLLASSATSLSTECNTSFTVPEAEEPHYRDHTVTISFRARNDADANPINFSVGWRADSSLTEHTYQTTDDWTQHTFTQTFGNISTLQALIIINSVGAHNLQIDNWVATFHETLDTIPDWTAIVSVKTDTEDLVFAGTSAGLIYQLHNKSQQWLQSLNPAVDISASYSENSPVTSLAAYAGFVYASFGNDAAFAFYSVNTGLWGSSSSDNTPTANERARLLVSTGSKLWRVINENSIQYWKSPNWLPADAYTVGDEDRSVTAMYSFRNSFVSVKTDGLWLWDGSADFINVTPEWDNDVNSSNLPTGGSWHTDLFLNSGGQSFLRYNGTLIEDITPYIISARLPTIGGKVTAMTTTSRELIIALEQAKMDSDQTKQAIIARLAFSPTNNQWKIHTFSVDDELFSIQQLVIVDGDTIYALGKYYDGTTACIAAKSWAIPQNSIAAFNDIETDVAEVGWFETSIWHGGIPDTPKACLALTIWTDGVDKNHSVDVSMGVDGLPSTDTVIGSFNGSTAIQTLYFENIPNHLIGAVGRFIQLRFTLHSNDGRSPKLYAFELHTQAFYPPIRIWTMEVLVGASLLRTGVFHQMTKSEIESAFYQLERQVFPITLNENFNRATLEEDLGTEYDGSTSHLVRLIEYERMALGDDVEQQQERWRLVFQEAIPIQPTE